MSMVKPKSTALPADLIGLLEYHSLERVQGLTITPKTWASLTAFSTRVSPSDNPHWWLRLLLRWRLQHPALPRAYYHNTTELILELQLKNRYEHPKNWGHVKLRKRARSGVCLSIYGQTWQLEVVRGPGEYQPTPSDILGLLKLHGYIIPEVKPMEINYTLLPCLAFTVDVWIGEPPEISSFSIGRFLKP